MATQIPHFNIIYLICKHPTTKYYIPYICNVWRARI